MSFPITHCYCDGKVLCGAKSANTLPPHLAKHVTCKRCLASLRKP